MKDTFSTHSTFTAGKKTYRYASLPALEKNKGWKVSRLPFSLRILLENLLRREDGEVVKAKEIEALANWNPKAEPEHEIAFMPGRVILQDFTGVPCVVDLAAMRDAMKKMGGDPKKIQPQQPVELVIDHSVQVDYFGSPDALAKNAEIEFKRNKERYEFLRWGQKAFKNFKVVPPDTGIVHQVNLEFLARVVMAGEDGSDWAYPDTVVGTDSHTTMVNGLAVLGWGVGGIEAEAAMLGQPVSMLIPQVVGFRLKGKLPEGATATDAVLTVTQMLRKKGVVGKFVEFCGPGLANLSLADRATIANMAPEYGATCGIFPVDQETLNYLRFTGRSEERIALVEAYMKAQGLFCDANTPEPAFSDMLELDLGTVEPSLAGPKRPQDRVNLTSAPVSLKTFLDEAAKAPKKPITLNGGAPVSMGSDKFTLNHGSVVIAAITSCTNTSNPSVLIAAGLVAKKAVEKGLSRKPWVKTSLAPGSKVVTDYLHEAGLDKPLNTLGFQTVGYGCTTCIGNSGPLPEAIGKAIDEKNLVAVSVLSGNRNFEGRVHQQVRANYLASPPLVVAYALAGRMDLDLGKDPIGNGKDGKPVYLKDIWPTQKEVADAISKGLRAEMYRKSYSNVYEGDENWRNMKVPEGDTYNWPASSYIKHPPYFTGMPKTPAPVQDIHGARCLALFADSITTDHISPAGSIKPASPAGKYLVAQGVSPEDFNSYGARRGNDEVMARGTFANIRIKNLMLQGVEGGETVHIPSGKQMAIYDAAMEYGKEKTPLIILAGKEYGSGSSRDWAAKGPMLQGVRAAIAESFERIHRSNLVGMGIVPLQFKPGQNAASLGLTGFETFDIDGVAKGGREAQVKAKSKDGKEISFTAIVRIDTPQEWGYYRNGGILQYVLRRLA